MAKVGRPARYDSVEELEKLIDTYFTKCPDTVMRVVDGKQKKIPAPTVSGLALYLGFVNRASMYDYEDKPEFTNTIKRAKAFMEREYEQMLRNNPTGAIFALKNFGWKDKTEVENTTTLQFKEPTNDDIKNAL